MRRAPPRSVASTFVNLKEDMMAHITYDPRAMTDPLDALFRGFLRPVRMDTEVPQIRMDVKENEAAMACMLICPGVDKDDIHVTIDGNTVSISAEVKKSAEQKDGEKAAAARTLRRSRQPYVSPRARSRRGLATARYQDGVLELVLPKKAATAARRLTVQ
jgi:HSP20 family protein